LRFRKKFIYFCLILLLILPIFLIQISKFVIIKNINKIENFNLKNFSVSPKGLKFENLIYKNEFLNLNFEKINLKKSFIKNAFALESSGEISNQSDKRKINVSGKVKGNIVNGNMNITDTQINIENIGDLKFYGKLENWGKEKFEGIFELNGLKVKEISEITKYKIPFDGKIYGRVFIEKEKENLKEIRFDIEIKELNQEYEESKLNLYVKGRYLPAEKSFFVENGLLVNESGEKLSFNGFIKENEFEFYFDTKGFSIDELLKLLPEEIRKKYNLKIEGSKISMNKFSFNFSKKKSYLMVNFHSTQNS
jgi:hypothetical protein